MHYYAGAPTHPGTNLPRNVTGCCPHKHRTPEAAEKCIRQLDASIKRGHGPDAYCDRTVMVNPGDGSGDYIYRSDEA